MSLRGVLKWTGRVLGGLVALAALAALVVWVWGASVLSRSYPVEERGFRAADHAVDVRAGERLARVMGCMDGCHGEGAAGRVFFEAPMVVRLVAPNLTRLEETYTDAEVEALVRQGVRPGGHSLWAMPSAAFAYLSDADLANVLAYLASLPDSDNDPGVSSYGLVGRFEMVRGEIIRPEAEKAAGIEPSEAPADGEERGEYLAMLACAECHGADLGGQVGFAPSLEIARSYDLAQFTRLMREGIALGEREVGLMSQVARGRFTHFADEDVAALHAFFHAR